LGEKTGDVGTDTVNIGESGAGWSITGCGGKFNWVCPASCPWQIHTGARGIRVDMHWVP